MAGEPPAFPLWWLLALGSVITILFVVSVLADIYSPDYDHPESLTVLEGAVVAAAFRVGVGILQRRNGRSDR